MSVAVLCVVSFSFILLIRVWLLFLYLSPLLFVIFFFFLFHMEYLAQQQRSTFFLLLFAAVYVHLRYAGPARPSSLFTMCRNFFF